MRYKIRYTAFFMIYLVVFISIYASNAYATVCGETNSTSSTSGTETAVVACADQTEETFTAISEEERSFWQVAMPIILVIIIIVVLFFCPPCGAAAVAGSGGATFTSVSLFSALMTAATTATVSITTTGWLIIAGLASSAYYSYGGFTDSLDGQPKSLTLWAKCNTTTTIGLTADDGDCQCDIVDVSANAAAVGYGNGQTIQMTGGKAYTMTATLIDFNWPHTSASCTCTANGIITTSGTRPGTTQTQATLPTAPPVTTAATAASPQSSGLVCCRTITNTCLENYMESSCTTAGGTPYCMSCSEVPACMVPVDISGMKGLGVFSITDDGTPVNFATQGDRLKIEYYLPTGGANVTVTAHIKLDGTEIEELRLYDDGNHNDNSANDLYYANEWRTSGALNGRNSGQITWDIEVKYGNLRTVTIPNAGSLILLRNGIDCMPIGSFNANATLDIIIAGNNYGNLDRFAMEAETTAARTMMTAPFTNYFVNPGINFYQVGNMFATDDITQIKTHAFTSCDYSQARSKMILVLDNDAVECTQDGYTIHLNPRFTYNANIASATMGSVLSDFCDYIDQLAVMNPPKPVILTENITSVPSQISIDFQIEDEEYPVEYELQWNYVTLVKSNVADNSVYTHVLNIPNGNWIVQIKARDKRGNVGYSNILSIVTNDTMAVDFSSLSPLIIPYGSSVNIDLNSYLNDPLNEAVAEWMHNPAFSQCVDFDPIDVITDGQVKITASGAAGCEDNIVFTAVTASGRSSSDAISLRIG